VHDRPYEVTEGGERELGLGLDAARAERRHSFGTVDGLEQEGSLAHAVLADDEERAAAPGPCGVEELGDLPQFGLAAVQVVRHAA
jgi:hypothetical protein